MRKHRRLAPRRLAPFVPGRQLHHCNHVITRRRSDFDRVSVKAPHHWRVHRVRRAERAEKERPIFTESFPALAPNGLNSRRVRRRACIERTANDSARDIHRQLASQRRKSAVHLGSDSARVGARARLGTATAPRPEISPPNIRGWRAIPKRGFRRRSTAAPCLRRRMSASLS